MSLEAMNILNEVAGRFPDAISLAAGRPPTDLLHPELYCHWIEHYGACAAESGRSRAAVWAELGQYSNTNGIVQDIVAQHLRVDEEFATSPDGCMICNGAQEAILIALIGLVGREGTVVATDPTYVGLTGAAAVLDIAVETVADGPNMLGELRGLLAERRRRGGARIGAVYCITDFSNPLGRVLSLADRLELLELAETFDFFIIEDAAYRRYRYEGEQLPSLKALDRTGRVVFVSSFAKTLLPGMRLAVMVADRRDADGRTLASRLSAIKSYVSVATSPMNQAALAGCLLESGFSLERWVSPRRERCRQNRDALIAALGAETHDLAVRWDHPSGGFFLSLDAPQPFNEEDCWRCASAAGVVVVPMRMFSQRRDHDRQIRLAFSHVSPSEIPEGARRLSGFLRSMTDAGLGLAVDA